MYAIVSPFWNTFDDIGLTYFIPEHLQWDIKKYCIVEIPLKNKIEIAVVLDLQESTDIDLDKIKSLISIKTSHTYLQAYQWELMYFIVKHYFTLVHNAAGLFFPRNLREKIKNEKIERELEKLESIKPEYVFNYDRSLTEKQSLVYNTILKSENNKHLLYGITGSGKTEIYIHLMKKYLDEWKQSLLLIPEIILWGQIGDRIKQVFWEEVIVINSTVTEATKTKYFLWIRSWKIKIVLGTRSALFYPYNDLWVIIVDEEHDGSYVSDSAPRYHWVEVAEKISELTWCKLLLASGTPSVKSMYRGVKWEYEVLNLLEKFSGN